MFCRNKLVYITLAVLILSAFSVYGVDFRVELTSVKNRITIDQVAEFKLTIYNREPTGQVFRIKNKEYPSWDIRSVPMANPILVEILANSNATIELVLDPNKKYVAPSGSYFISMGVVAESTGEALLEQARVSIVSSDELVQTYVPTVLLSTDFPDKINPSNELSFSVKLSNQNALNITGAKLTLKSSLIDESVNVNIMPNKEKVVNFKKTLDPKTKPLIDKLRLSLDYQGNNIKEESKSYEIVPYSEIQDITQEVKLFLRKTQTITFTNKANVKFSGELMVKTAFFNKLFGSTSPKASLVKDKNGLNYAWSVELGPYESYTVTIKENYLGIFILLIVVVLILILLLIKRAPVVLTKQAVDVELIDEALSRVKIILNIKNRSGKKIEEVALIEKLPKMLDFERNELIGTMKPSKTVKNLKKETFIVWEFPELAEGEERVIYYHLKSNLNILGGITLQPAMVKFKLKNNLLKIKSKKIEVKV